MINTASVISCNKNIITFTSHIKKNNAKTENQERPKNIFTKNKKLKTHRTERDKTHRNIRRKYGKTFK